MRGRRDEVGDRDRVRVQAGGHQAGDVRHVDEDQGADLAGHLGDPVEVDLPRIGAGAGEDQLGPVLAGQLGDLVVVDPLGLRVDAVADRRIPAAREVELHPVRQVAAVGQVHRQDGVADLQAGEVDRLVGRGPRMGLDVGVLGAEEGLGAVDGEPFGLVDELAAAVVAPAGEPFGVLVRQHRADGLHDRRAGVVLRGDQLQVVALATLLGDDRLGDLGVDALQDIHRVSSALPGVGGRVCDDGMPTARPGAGRRSIASDSRGVGWPPPRPRSRRPGRGSARRPDSARVRRAGGSGGVADSKTSRPGRGVSASSQAIRSGPASLRSPGAAATT